MIPWEKDLYVDMLRDYNNKENQRIQDLNNSNRKR